MSWSVTMKVRIKDLDLFAAACLENDLNLDNKLTVTKHGKFIGSLKKDDEDMTGGSYKLVTDSDYVGAKKSVNMDRVMRDYSEKVCRKKISSVGTILERIENEEGVLLRIAV